MCLAVTTPGRLPFGKERTGAVKVALELPVRVGVMDAVARGSLGAPASAAIARCGWLIQAALFAWLIVMWGASPAFAVEPTSKVEGWDLISIAQVAKVSTNKRAILIANSAYRYVNPLPAPPHDVEAMASQLRQLGFETTILQNPTSEEIINAIQTANPKEGRGSLLTLYYSGHGAEVDGQNSLLLTGYRVTEGRNDDQVIPLKVILWLLASANFDKVFVAFDACRNIVVTQDAKPTGAPPASTAPPGLPKGLYGLARSDSDFQVLNRKEYAVLFSTSHGDPALDSTVEGLSPFTRAFLLALGREASFMPAMLLTKRITEELTKKRQSPDIQIKWNSDITYARSSAVVNSAVYELNNQITAAEMANSTPDLAKITTFEVGSNTTGLLKAIEAANRIMKQMGREPSATPPLTENQGGEERKSLRVLHLKSDDFTMCEDRSYKPFFWHSDVLSIDYCYMTQLGYKGSDIGKSVFAEEGGAVYNTARYWRAAWGFDLDFDGSPETIEASLRNADMALTVISKTSEFEFRGLIGPNIEFVGLHDFNKDGILDVYIVYSMFDYTQGRELVILDGRKVARDLKTVKRCTSEEAKSPGACKSLMKIRRRMIGSLFTYDIDKGNYGADILQVALYADWNIKNWSIDESGILHLTTYSATWPYERKQHENYMMDKVVAYDPLTGKVNVSLSGEKKWSTSITPLKSQIDRGPTADEPDGAKEGLARGSNRRR